MLSLQERMEMAMMGIRTMILRITEALLSMNSSKICKHYIQKVSTSPISIILCNAGSSTLHKYGNFTPIPYFVDTDSGHISIDERVCYGFLQDSVLYSGAQKRSSLHGEIIAERRVIVDFRRLLGKVSFEHSNDLGIKFT